MLPSSRTAIKSLPRIGKKYFSVWEKVPKGPEDPILGVTVAFNKDTNPSKINLGVGAYRTDEGKPFILQSVRKAEKLLFDQNIDHEYAPIGGVPSFVKVVQELQLGQKHPILAEKRAVTVQALSGTGALRVGADFMHRWLDTSKLQQKKQIFVPNPTWTNHLTLYDDAGYKVNTYKYYNQENCGLNFKGMLEDIENAPTNSLFLFHVCAHNPTGVDPDLDQWKQLSERCKKKGHFVFFDLAYQGFASGDPERDAKPIHIFINDGHNVAIAQSFAKNFGLYGERVGALTFITKDAKEAEAVESQMKILIRPMYSNPPVYGARVVSTILSDPELSALWRKEVKLMADRIISMRTSLFDLLVKLGSKKDWSHIKRQIGMFCYSGISPEQVDRLASEFHVYLTRNGRISIAGITSKNVEHLAKSIHQVTK